MFLRESNSPIIAQKYLDVICTIKWLTIYVVMGSYCFIRIINNEKSNFKAYAYMYKHILRKTIRQGSAHLGHFPLFFFFNLK